MDFFTALPRELLLDVIQWLPLDVLLECRLVSRIFRLIATPVAFSQVQVDLNNEQLIDAHSLYHGNPDAYFPAQDLIIHQSQIEPLSVVWTCVVELLSHATDLKTLLMPVPSKSKANEVMMAEYVTIASMPSLRHLIFTGYSVPKAPPIVPRPYSKLTHLEIKGGMVFRADFHYILQLLRHLPHLHRLYITLPVTTVDGQALPQFLDSSIGNERQHVNMKDMDFSFFCGFDKTFPDMAELAFFFAYLMPNLDSLRVQAELIGPDGFIIVPDQTSNPGQHLRPLQLKDQAHVTFNSLITFCPPLEVDLTLSNQNDVIPIFARLPRSLLHSLTIAVDENVPVPFAWEILLSSLTSLRKLEMFMLDLKGFNNALMRMPASAQLERLEITSCLLQSPILLEQVLSKLPSLLQVRLNSLFFDDWQYVPVFQVENPWVATLLALFDASFVRMPEQQPFHFFSLPLSSASIRICDFHALWEERVIVLLQDINHAKGEPMQMWMHTSLIENRMRMTDKQKLTNEEATAVLSQAAGHEQQWPSDLARRAFISLTDKLAVSIYVCTSATAFEIEEVY